MKYIVGVLELKGTNTFYFTMCARTDSYPQQQNKWYPQGVNLPISKLRSILVIANLLAQNNLWLCYYGKNIRYG